MNTAILRLIYNLLWATLVSPECTSELHHDGRQHQIPSETRGVYRLHAFCFLSAAVLAVGETLCCMPGTCVCIIHFTRVLEMLISVLVRIEVVPI
jgi:hypothetical protein